MFPIAPHFYPICFAQSYPLFTYIGGAKTKGKTSTKQRKVEIGWHP
jgi:hypothetical protein